LAPARAAKPADKAKLKHLTEAETGPINDIGADCARGAGWAAAFKSPIIAIEAGHRGQHESRGRRAPSGCSRTPKSFPPNSAAPSASFASVAGFIGSGPSDVDIDRSRPGRRRLAARFEPPRWTAGVVSQFALRQRLIK
jgi:hypothetical protein